MHPTHRLALSLALSPYDHTRGLRPRGIELTELELPIEEIFYRFTRFREFDVSEMSSAKMAALLAAEKPDIIALPVFVSRVFRHSSINSLVSSSRRSFLLLNLKHTDLRLR